MLSSGALTALLPHGDPGDPVTSPDGRAVTVTLINLDPATGQPVPGESVALANGFTFVRPTFTSDVESDFTRACRVFLQMLKREVLPNVSYAVQTDYDPTSGDELHVTQFASLPALILLGPDTNENRFYSLNEPPRIDDGTVSTLDGESAAGYLEARVPYTVDVLWDVVAASNTKVELLNLMAGFVAFMHKNKWIVLDRLGTDPSAGAVRYELDFQPNGQPKNTSAPSNANLRSWSAKVLIRGFDIECFAGFLGGTTDPSHVMPQAAVVAHGQSADYVTVDPAVQEDLSSTAEGASPEGK